MPRRAARSTRRSPANRATSRSWRSVSARHGPARCRGCEPSGARWAAAVRSAFPIPRARGVTVRQLCGRHLRVARPPPVRASGAHDAVGRMHSRRAATAGASRSLRSPRASLHSGRRRSCSGAWSTAWACSPSASTPATGSAPTPTSRCRWCRARSTATQIRFDFARFAHGPERDLVQLGWWMTRMNAICDLPVAVDNALGLRKVRAAPAAHHRMAVGLARAEREHDGWAETAPMLATTDAGALTPSDRARVLRSAVVFADLYDANADPVVLDCIGKRHPDPRQPPSSGRRVPGPRLPALLRLAGGRGSQGRRPRHDRGGAPPPLRRGGAPPRDRRTRSSRAIRDSDVFAGLT